MPSKNAAKSAPNQSTTDFHRTSPAQRTSDFPPNNSQSSTNSTSTASNGTKRVVSNGEPVVLNSDTDTDSDGLAELEIDFIKSSKGFRGTKTAPANNSAPCIELLENGLRRPSDKPRQPKPSLQKYVKDVKDRAEKERNVADWKAELEKPIEETPPPDPDITEEALAGQIDGDGDGDTAKRLLLAMQRTESMDMKCVFHFFNDQPNPHSFQHPPFPIESLPQHRWTAQFEGIHSIHNLY